MRGGRPGAGARGGRPGVDTDQVAPDVHYHRIGARVAINTITATAFPDRVYPWHVPLNMGALSAGTPAADTLYALPGIFPRGGTIDTLLNVQRSGGGVGGQEIRWGIYANVGASGLFPGTRLWDSGDMQWTGNQKYTASPALQINTPGVYWLVSLVGSDFVSTTSTLDMVGSAQAYPLLGVSGALGGASAAPSFGVSHAYAFAALPATFPTSSPTWLFSGNVPTAYFRWTDGV